MVTKLLGEIDVLENQRGGMEKVSAIDKLFEWHGKISDSLAVRYFKDFRDKAPGKRPGQYS